jgi:hypothetical protein
MIVGQSPPRKCSYHPPDINRSNDRARGHLQLHVQLAIAARTRTQMLGDEQQCCNGSPRKFGKV